MNPPVHDSSDKIADQNAAAGEQQDIRARAGEALDAARERGRGMYDSARERASSAVESTKAGLDANPVAYLIGGVAIGALLGALLPRSRREVELLGDLGRRLNERAKTTALSARDAGLSKMDDIPLVSEGARKKVKEMTGADGEAS